MAHKCSTKTCSLLEMAKHVTDSLNLKLQVLLKLAVEGGVAVPLKRTQAVLRIEDKAEQVESMYKHLWRTKVEAIRLPFQLCLKRSESECTKIQQAAFEQQNRVSVMALLTTASL